MSFHPNQIEKDHVIAAVKRIDSEKPDLHPSTRWDVEINGKLYPPKEVMRYARMEYDGSGSWKYGGGPPTNKYLERMGFEIIDKGLDKDPLREVIETYKSHIKIYGLEDELYKWNLLAKYRGRPNAEASNLHDEIKNVNFANLLYYNAYRAMTHLAKDRTESYRVLLRGLFDESLDLKERVIEYDKNTAKLYRELVPDQTLGHHQDERTISTLLTFHNPEKYTFYKNSFYIQLCQLIGVKTKSKGEKFVHYLELVKDFIEDYIQDDEELLELVKVHLPEDSFEDPEHLILAQDIIYGVFDRKIGMDRRYWRIGTSADDTSYWSNMEEKNRVAIGWSNLGDLDDLNVQSKQEMYKIFKDKNIKLANNQTTSRKAGEIFSFYSELSIGDIVLAQEGDTIYGIGEITEGYTYNESEDFAHEKGVNWKVINPPFKNKSGRNTTFYPLEDYSLIQKINNHLNDKIENGESNLIENRKESMEQLSPLNSILFGPPGTGKTYKTKELAVNIANQDFKTSSGLGKKERREKIVEEYNRLFDVGQIVFTTFHQSFSYEDFVEGIKPKTTENKQVIYDIAPGVFKKLCEKAKDNWLEYSKGGKNKLPFDEALQNLKEDWEENEDLKFPLKTEGKEYKIIGFTESSIQFKKASGGTGHTLSISTLRDAYYGKREIKPTGIGIYYPGILKELQSYGSKNLNSLEINGDRKKLKNYVLIIDEINRGNVSGIFGELITLLEQDKRLGREEEIAVELPYSKEQFTVPPNVYLIGTMNTADRSVEALDTALRRRFAFEEVMPLPSLLKDIEFDGFNLSELLTVINERIEALLDHDHTIGHSYFISIQSGDTKALKQAFENKVIPLLQEYFYHDYKKIALILDEGFITHKEANVKFAKFKNVDQPELNTSFELKQITDIEEAIRILLNQKDEES
jgi:hypothetical protein